MGSLTADEPQETRSSESSSADQDQLEAAVDVDKRKVIVNYLPSWVDEPFLRAVFGSPGIGQLVGCKIVCRYPKISRGYAFLDYADEESASNALTMLDGFVLCNSMDVSQQNDGPPKKLKVSYCRPANAAHKNTNLFVTGVPCEWTEEQLLPHFAPFGEIITHKLAPRKQCPCYANAGDVPAPCEKVDWAFVRYARHDSAKRAKAALDNQPAVKGRRRVLKVDFPHKESRCPQ